MLNTSNDKVMSWKRETAGSPTVVVACNFTSDSQTIDLSGGGSKEGKALVKTPGMSDPASVDKVELGPFGVYVGQVR